MKILLVGPFASAQRDAAILEGFKQCGCDALSCQYGDILFSGRFLSRVQFRLNRGPVFREIQNRVLEAIKQIKPDVVFFRRPLEFSSEMIQEIRNKSQSVLASFNNDDPFSEAYKNVKWRELRNAIPDFDVHFAFRSKNIQQYYDLGAKQVALWEPFYVPWLHRPLVNTTDWISHGNKVLFAMHAEVDERREAIFKLIQSGVNLDIHSWNWAKVFGKNEALALQVKPPVWEDEYVRTIGNAMATLCFFSKQNNDELTSRVFEIPACLGLLLSHRTDRIEQLFKHWEEAVFFSGSDELLDIVNFLTRNPDTVAKIKEQGRTRLLRSNCSVVDRCRDAVTVLKALL